MSEPTVRLRAITEADLPNYVRWFNDPEVIQWLSREPGLTLDEEREWFKRISAPDHRDLNLAIEADGRHIGGTGLDFHRDGRTATFGICIGDKASWGRGYGTTALREVLRVGFEERGLHRIMLGARADNARAIRCYAKCGFRQEGRERRAAIYAGEWYDNVLMAILREEWEADRNASAPHTKAVGNGIRIRGYRPADYDQVADVWRAVGFTLRIGDSAEALDRKVARDPDLVLVAELDGRIVGSAFGAWDGRRAFINRVAVDPAYQRRGIGTRLMQELARRLAVLGAQRLGLLTGGDRRSEAVRFYESLGYELREDVRYLGKDLGSES